MAAAGVVCLRGRPCAAPWSLRCGRPDSESQTARLLPLLRALPGQTYFRPQAPRGINEASRRLRHQQQLERGPPRERLVRWVPLLLPRVAAAAAVPASRASEAVAATTPSSSSRTNGSRASPPWEVCSRNGFKNCSPRTTTAAATTTTSPPRPLPPPPPQPLALAPAPAAAPRRARGEPPALPARRPLLLGPRARPGRTAPRLLLPLPLLAEQRKHPMMMCGRTKLR